MTRFWVTCGSIPYVALQHNDERTWCQHPIYRDSSSVAMRHKDVVRYPKMGGTRL
ncbi:hypothetical protein CCP3SC1_900003 [Gammaproteobacteria bacterium]